MDAAGGVRHSTPSAKRGDQLFEPLAGARGTNLDHPRKPASYLLGLRSLIEGVR